MEADKNKADIEPKDKRTKEYKDWKARQEAKSDEKLLGDRIEDFTKATGIKKAVETVTKAVGIKDCGCNTRKEQINNFHERIKKVFIHKQPLLLTEDEFLWLKDYFDQNRTRVTHQNQLDVLKIYNRVYSTNKTPTGCPSCYRDVVRKLRKLMDLQRA